MTTRKQGAGEHHFNFETDHCVGCGMSEQYFEDHGKPPCRGPARDQTAQRSRGGRSAPSRSST
jgi:hypothetical protein